MSANYEATIIWKPVKKEACYDCHGTGWQDKDRYLICVSCMGYGYQVYYEQQIIRSPRIVEAR